MISSRRMLKTLAALLPLGAAGVSVALAATPAKPIDSDPGAHDIAARLHAIRAAVSEVTAEQIGFDPNDPDVQKAQWVNWGGPGWRNGGWRNGGWRNGGGWGNGGWPNWNNYSPWNNWHNLWRNW